MVRLPRYAGRHYFADPGRLRASVESFVEDAAAVSVPGTLCAVVVPHGAHPEFGSVAGHAYKLLLSVPLTSELTVLLAPAAAAPDDSRAVLCDPSDAYATPLDLIGVAAAALDELDRMGVAIMRAPDEEPVIENHLPFIQVAMGDTQCLPLRVPAGADLGTPAWDAAASRFGLIIAAANLPLSHEQAACDAIERLDERFFTGEAPAARPGGLKGLFGAGSRRPAAPSADAAVLALAIRLAKAKGADRGRLLARQGRLAAFALYRAR
ncbi:MAG: AmmeMemoRadiSam system protein B [Anaerolineae bacterium]|nr:AmmeMemoRadiSam system protein B [Candidatus Roseilinea sp.]MDW8450527.1 AmmeMemoRadiSam system protein B [Anaerolineae bacterium]